MPTALPVAPRPRWWRRAALGLAAALERLDDDLLLLCDCSDACTCDGRPVVADPTVGALAQPSGL